MTLVEMVTSMSILCVLIVAMGSAILISTRALEVSAAAETDDAEKVRLRMISDLQTALSFTEQTATAATFTVPDRDGDGLPETLRYAWAGTLGDPLTYSYNDGNAITLAADVQQFNMTYLLRTMQGMGGIAPDPNEGPPPQESDEVVLIFHDDNDGQFVGQKVDYTLQIGAYFVPELPTNTVSWKITRVTFRAKKVNNWLFDLQVQIRPAGADQYPSGTVLEQQVLDTAAFSTSYSWEEASFSTLEDLDPNQDMCLVFNQAAGTSSASSRIRYETNLQSGTTTPNTNYIYLNSGAWTKHTPEYKSDLRFYVYGTYTTLGEPEWP